MVTHMARADAWSAKVTIWILCFALCFCVPIGVWLIRGGLLHEDEARAERIRNERQRKLNERQREELEQLKKQVEAMLAEKGSNDTK